MQEASPISLITIIGELKDPRVARTRLHKLEDIVVIGLCGMLCGAESFEEMQQFGEAKEEWFSSFLELPHGIPSHDTFNRVFAALDPETFLGAFMKWTAGLRQACDQEIVAMDGKALRRALDAGENTKVIVSAWAASNGLVLGQRKVSDKSDGKSRPSRSYFAVWN